MAGSRRMAIAVAGALALAAGGCGSSSGRTASSTTAPSPTVTSTTASTTASTIPPVTHPVIPAPTPDPGRTTTGGSVPVVVCPTTFGAGPPATKVTIPSKVDIAAPATVVASLAVYTDQGGLMRIVAPKGWACAASYGADGSGGVAAYPKGTALPADGIPFWTVRANSTVQAVTGEETSACSSCTLGQACPLFAAAAASFRQELGHSCPAAKPAAETVTTIRSGIVGFTDPRGVAGDARPSGGVNAASGVMTYHRDAAAGSWEATCTLPAADAAECTTGLDAFVGAYGSD